MTASAVCALEIRGNSASCEGKEERVTVVVKSFAHLFLSIRREGSFLLECGERFFSFKSVYSRGTYIAT